MGVPSQQMASQNVSKKRKFVADGVFYAELNELFTRELAEDGYSGVEVRQTPARHEIIIRATRTQEVLGEKRRRPGRVSQVQAPGRTCRASCMLRCDPLRDGERSPGCRSHCVRKDSCPACQSHEVLGWIHDQGWYASASLRRQRRPSRYAASGCHRYQVHHYVAP